MPATIEWVVGIVRSGADHRKLGDPYDFSATVVKDGTAAHIMGGAAPDGASVQVLRDCLRVLKRAGIARARWKRVKSGTINTVEVDL